VAQIPIFCNNYQRYSKMVDAVSGGNVIATSLSGAGLTLLPLVSTTYYAETYNYNAGSQTFSYTGSSQQFTTPSGIISLNIDAYGAQGGASSYGSAGLGGRVQASLTVFSGQVLYLYIGGANSGINGGWNGGEMHQVQVGHIVQEVEEHLI